LKIGTENRTKVIIASVLGLLALIQMGRMLFPSAPSGAPAAALQAASGSAGATPARAAARGGKGAVAVASLDPRLQLNLLQGTEGAKYAGTGRNIFLPQEEIVIPTTVKPVAALPVVPPGPPPPPPINLKFFGFASRPGEPKRVFLSQGDDVFIAREGDIVDRRYKVVHIAPAAVEIEDVLNNHRQSIPLTQS
jgi:hypothetical protein